MRSLAALIVVLGLMSATLGCGGATFFVAGHSGPFVSLSGTVSIVQLTVIGSSTVTVVTLLIVTGAQTVNFCGNVVNQFPINTFLTVNFNQATPCSSLVQVII